MFFDANRVHPSPQNWMNYVLKKHTRITDFIWTLKYCSIALYHVRCIILWLWFNYLWFWKVWFNYNILHETEISFLMNLFVKSFLVLKSFIDLLTGNSLIRNYFNIDLWRFLEEFRINQLRLKIYWVFTNAHLWIVKQIKRNTIFYYVLYQTCNTI